MAYSRGCLPAASILFILSIGCLVLSSVLKADASRARSQALSSMNAAVDRMYSSDDPDYQNRYAGEIQAERIRRAGSIGRQYDDAMSLVIFIAVFGWIGVILAIVFFTVIRRKAMEQKQMTECGVSCENWGSSAKSPSTLNRGKHQVRIVDDGSLPDPEIIRRNRLIAFIFFLLLIGIPVLIAISD